MVLTCVCWCPDIDRMGLVSYLKQLTLVHIWLWCIFLSSALISVLLQITILPIWPFSKRWYRTINGELTQLFWFEYVWLAEHWAGSCLYIHCKEEDTLFISTEHVLMTLNHRSDLDWIVIWQMASRFNRLPGGKALMKDELKYLPLLGWSFYLAEQIFVKRNFHKDKESLLKQLMNLYSYHLPTTTVIFCEGTRYTKEKYELSQAFAKDRGIPGLSHHLLPRTKGFSLCVEAYKGKGHSVYDATIAYEGGHAPSLYEVMCGKRCDCHLYIRRYPLDSIPTESEAATAEFCYEMYREKDRVYDFFLKHGTFTGYDPSRPKRKYPQSLRPVCAMWFWIVVIGLPLIYVTIKVLMTGSVLMISIAVFAYFGVERLAKFMINLTQAGSRSAYGLGKEKQK